MKSGFPKTVLYAVFACLTMSAASASSAASLAVGQPFPKLAFPDLDGNPTSIDRFRGQKMVLHIFASW